MPISLFNWFAKKPIKKNMRFKPECRLFEDRIVPTGDLLAYPTSAYGIQVAAKPDGTGFIDTFSTTGSSSYVYYQIYNASGNPVGSATRVDSSTSTETSPSIGIDKAGNFVIAWAVETDTNNGIYDIQAREFNASGTAQGAVFAVDNPVTLQSQTPPYVSVDPTSGKFVIAWNSVNNDINGNSFDVQHVLARYYNSDTSSTPATSVITVAVPDSNTGGENPNLGSVAIRPDGTFVVAYDALSGFDNNTFQPQSSGYFRRFNANGTAIDSSDVTFSSNSSEGLYIHPQAAVDSSGNFVLVWNGSASSGNVSIYQERFHANGTAYGAATTVNTSASSSSVNAPSVSAINGGTNDGEYAIGYQIGGSTQNSSNVVYRTFGAITTGTAITPSEVQINKTIANPASSVNVSLDPSGKLIAGYYENSLIYLNLSGYVSSTPTVTASPSSLTLGPTTTGTASASQSFTVGGSNLTNNISVTAPTGVEISTSSNGTYSNSVTLTQSGGTVASTTLYARISASAGANSISNHIAVTSSGATEQDVSVTGSVAPVVSVNPTSQSVANLANTTTIQFSSNVTGTTYTWSNNNTTIGIGASGSGSSIASFTATNTGTTPVTATFMVTPTANGISGAPVSFTVTVNPTPVVSVNPTSQSVANNANTSTIQFSSNVTGTTYTWSNNNSTIGIGASGSGPSIPSFTAINTGTVPVTATFMVTPQANGVSGTPVSFTITVNPTPIVMVTPTSQAVPNLGNTTTIQFSSNVTGTTYTWSNNNTTIGIGASGSGSSIASFTATNTGSAPVTATFMVTPHANGVNGTPVSFTITVNPTPSVSVNPTSQSVANNALTTAITFSSNVANTSYAWTNNNTSIGIGASGFGSSIPSFTAINTGTAPVTATFMVTPQANGVSGTPASFTITVNPTPVAMVTPTSQSLANNANTSTIVFSSNVAGTTYSWTNDTTSIGLGASGSGSTIPSFTATNSSNAPVKATITITPTANGVTGASVTATITVGPATTTPIVTVASETTPFTGSPQAYPITSTDVTVTDLASNTVPVPTDGTLSYSYSGIGYGPTSTAPTNAGTYTVTASFTSTVSKYNNATGTGTYTISAVKPTVTAANETTPYSGSPAYYPISFSDISVTGIGNDPNPTGNLFITYQGIGTTTYPASLAAPTNAGTYSVTASFTSGDPNYSNTTGSGTFTITAVAPTVNVTSETTSFTGSPISFPVTSSDLTVSGLAGNDPTPTGTFSYQYSTSSTNPTSTPPTFVGTYHVAVTFHSTDGNYTNATGSGTLTIGKATPTVVVTDPGGIAGFTNPATATVNGGATLENVGLTLDYVITANNKDLGSTAPTTTGTYQVTASFAGSTDYNPASSSTTFTISPAIYPVITPPATQVVEATSSAGALDPNAFTATATTGATLTYTVGSSVVTNFASYVFPIGTTKVTVSATNSANLSATSTYNVLVQDTTAPVLTLPSNQNISATSGAGKTDAAAFTATATDAVTTSPTIVYSVGSTPITSSYVFPTGTTTVTVTATDAAGNSSKGTFTVQVQVSTGISITSPSTVAITQTTSSQIIYVTIGISSPLPAQAYVFYKTVDITTTANVDYASIPTGTYVQFAAGQTSATVPITIYSRSGFTQDKSFQVILTSAKIGVSTISLTTSINAATITLLGNQSTVPYLALSSANTNINAGSPVTFSATLYNSGATIPSGTVTFYDGTTLLGTFSASTIGKTKSWTLSSTLSTGIHTITAVFTPSVGSPVTSISVTETVV